MCPFALCHDYGFKFIRFHLSTSSHTHDETGERERTIERTNKPKSWLVTEPATTFAIPFCMMELCQQKKKKHTHTKYNERLQYLNSEREAIPKANCDESSDFHLTDRNPDSYM